MSTVTRHDDLRRIEAEVGSLIRRVKLWGSLQQMRERRRKHPA